MSRGAARGHRRFGALGCSSFRDYPPPNTCPVPTAGLTEPVLIRLDVDAKLNEQLKVRLHPCPCPSLQPRPREPTAAPLPTDSLLRRARGHQGCRAAPPAAHRGAAPGPDGGVCGHEAPRRVPQRGEGALRGSGWGSHQWATLLGSSTSSVASLELQFRVRPPEGSTRAGYRPGQGWSSFIL